MLQLNFSPFPELKTRQLVLRKLTLEDAPELYFLRSSGDVLKYIGRQPATSINEVRDFILTIHANVEKNDSIFWAIAMNKKPSELIGTICYWRLQPENYRAEIGYTLHPQFWGKGIMKEAVEAVLDYGFDIMKLHSIEARLNAENLASARLLEKTGFTRDAYFREDYYFNGKFSDTLVYSRLK